MGEYIPLPRLLVLPSALCLGFTRGCSSRSSVNDRRSITWLNSLSTSCIAPVLFRRNKSRNRDGPGHDVMREKQSTATQSTASREWWGLKPFLMSNALHILLVFVPAGILTGHMGWNSTAVFVLNMLAILPLAMLLSNATEELAAEAGQVVGALLNATFGNAVEMIVSAFGT